MSETKSWTEEFAVDGDMLISKIKDLFHEGNIRRITILNEDGNVIVDLPMTLGLVGAVIAPQLAAVGAVAALVTKCTLRVEKVQD
jgi:hypothetical protein